MPFLVVVIGKCPIFVLEVFGISVAKIRTPAGVGECYLLRYRYNNND